MSLQPPNLAPFDTAQANVNRPAADASRPAGAALSTRKIPLGEELPIFCEKCGYALHGLPQTVCSHCSIRQFHCPECGHHQPINTLRPAVQKLLGRLRALGLALLVLFKINFFGWLLFAWVGMGYGWSYRFENEQRRIVGTGNRQSVQYVYYAVPREIDTGQVMAFVCFGFAFGAVGRMLLLRWRRGYLIGLWFAGLVTLMLITGALWHRYDNRGWMEVRGGPFTSSFIASIIIAAATLILSASIVWGIWSALAQLFLPRRASQALLEWQINQSDRAAADLGKS